METSGGEFRTRARSPLEFVSEDEHHARLYERFGLTGTAIQALAAGDALVELPDAVSSERRGLFAHSSEALINAQTEAEREDAWQYVKNDVHSALFEEITHSGHLEIFRLRRDPSTGDAYAFGDQTLDVTFLRDLTQPTYKWRARLSFVEFMNSSMISELSRRGVLKDTVVIENSCYEKDAPIEQTRAVGYRPDNQKGYLRSSYDEADERLLETLSYSFLEPADVSELYRRLGLPSPIFTTTEEALSHPVILPKITYQQLGGLSGLARLLDEIKTDKTAIPHVYGNQSPSLQTPSEYAQLAQLSAERKLRAGAVVENLALQIVRTYLLFKQGSINLETAIKCMGAYLLEARLDALKSDRVLAVEQHGLAIAAQLDTIMRLRAMGLHEEARKAEQEVQKELGTAYICGMTIQLDENGKPVNPDGSEADCKEIKNGDYGVCPGCKKYVKIIVKDKDKLFCSRRECKLSMSGGSEVVKIKEPSTDKKPATVSAAGAVALAGVR